MSFWTYIRGSMVVSPLGSTQPEKRYILDTVLNHLPRVTGSEGDMDVYVVEKRGTNSSRSHNEFEEYMGHRGFRDDRMRTQDEYILVVDGNLRDRNYEQTVREFMKWVTRLAKRVGINSISVNIRGHDMSFNHRELVLHDENPFRQMEEPPSWCNDGGEPAWAEYLLWESAREMRYPMKLAYKYYNDPENDAEVERRRAWERGEGAK